MIAFAIDHTQAEHRTLKRQHVAGRHVNNNISILASDATCCCFTQQHSYYLAHQMS